MMTIWLPLPAIVSILTRVSGVFIFLGMAVLIWLLDLSLRSEAGFDQATRILDAALVKLLVWAIVAGLIYHTLAGLRHLVADFGYGESLEGGILGSWIVLILSALLIAMAGVWIW